MSETENIDNNNCYKTIAKAIGTTMAMAVTIDNNNSADSNGNCDSSESSDSCTTPATTLMTQQHRT